MDPKQAVILIHGIGEQKPNQTLRSFVRAVAGDRFFNKADHISSIPELRRLQLFGDKNTHPTDCYELYWAHNTQEKTLPIALYFARLLLKRDSQFDRRQLKYVTLLRVLSVALLACFLYFSLKGGEGALIKAVSALSPPVLLYVTYRFVYNYFGKASAYMSPTADTVENRSRIRNQGIELLKKVHQSGRYFRVIVVGHSLGSVIGYDILRHYWTSIVPDASMTPPKGKLFEEFKRRAAVLDDESLPRAQRLELFQQAQHELWRGLRECGFPWLVTDLVTLGSPLAHAPVLMWEDRQEFAQRVAEREYPQCPPNAWPTRELRYPFPLVTPDGPRSFNRPEQDCLFALTRWTNIFFESSRLLRGDVIGGPLAGLFGQGVRDVAVAAQDEPAWCHTGYWKGPKGAAGPYGESLGALVSALRLETRRSKRQWPKP